MSGLYYESQPVGVLVGSKTATGTRTPVTLTSAYDVPNKTKILETGGFSKINIDILYTMGASETANSIQMRVECSSDGVNFYRIPNESVSGGTSTLTQREFTYVGVDGAASTISIGLDIFYKWMRFSFKESGVASNAGTVFAEYTLSGK
jgi:hypothetical protein